jgi:hypothetical protein
MALIKKTKARIRIGVSPLFLVHLEIQKQYDF